MASHRRDIGTAGPRRAVLIAASPLCRGYAGVQQAASISYAGMSIFDTNGSAFEPTVEMEDGSLSDR